MGGKFIFLILAPSCLVLRRKIRKIATLAYFWPKNAYMQKFLWPKMSVVGAGWPKFFRPAPKISKSVPKKIFMDPAPFWGSGPRQKPKKPDFWLKMAKNRKIQNFFGRNFCTWVPGPPPNFFPNPKSLKVYPKIFLAL